MEANRPMDFNPSLICQAPKCPEKSSARLKDDHSRKDLCAGHALSTWRRYKDDLEVVAAWNELTMEDFMNIEENENIEIDPDHPWIQAVMAGANPSPVPTSIKFDAVHINQGDDVPPMKAAMLSVITPVGAFTFFLSPNILQQTLIQGAEILDEWSKEQQQGLIVADKNMERQVVQDSKAAENLFRKN